MLAAIASSTQGFVVHSPRFSMPARDAPRASALMSSAEDEAKAAWLAKLDAPAWGKAAEAMSTVAEEASHFQKLNKECDSGDSTACDAISREEEAKIAWLAKIDVPSWGQAAAAMKEIGKESMPSASEEAAKIAWLAKLDEPGVWGQAAAAMTSIVAEANFVAGLTEDAGTSAAETLAKENEAKRRWLARLDVPSWGTMTEESAKRKWLARLDVASWKGKVVPSAPAAAEPAVFRMEVTEEEAKAKWLAKLDDEPSWKGKVAQAALAR